MERPALAHWRTALVNFAGAYYAFGALMMMFALHEPAIANLAGGMFGAGVVVLGVAWLVRGDLLPGLGTGSLVTSFALAGHGSPRELAAVLAITLAICALAHAAEFGPRRSVALAAAAVSVALLVAIAVDATTSRVVLATSALGLHAVLGAMIGFTSSAAIDIGRVRRVLGSRADSTR